MARLVTNPTSTDRKRQPTSVFEKQVGFCFLAFPRMAYIIPFPCMIFVYYNLIMLTPPPFMYVPLQPFHVCNGQIEKVICKVTYFVGTEDDAATKMPIQPQTDSLCREFISMSLSELNHTYVELPVCIQDAYTFGPIVYHNKNNGGLLSSFLGTKTDIHLVQNEYDTDLREYMLQRFSSQTGIRKIYSKKVDFPHHYQFVFNWSLPEVSRDDNYGNMVWRYASHKMINPITINNLLYNTRIKYNPPLGDADALVIATANALQLTEKPSLNEYVSLLTKRVMERNITTIVLGLGVQIEHDSQTNATVDDITPETIRDINSTQLKLYFPFQEKFLTEISKRQTIPAIGVRGDLTATICRNSNINNCVSMGCPSLSISRDLNLGRTLETNWNNVIRNIKRTNTKKVHTTNIRIALACPAPNSSPRIVYMVLKLFTYIVQRHGYQSVTLIAQSPLDKDQMKTYIDKEWNPLNNTINVDSTKIKFVEFLNVETWLHSAFTDYDICISARIHGSMPFVSTGTPVVAIPTDHRIVELLLAMNIPYILPTDLDEKIIMLSSNNNKNNNKKKNQLPVLSLMENAINTNFTKFEINRRTKLIGWKKILTEAGLEMDPSLLKIINQ